MNTNEELFIESLENCVDRDVTLHLNFSFTYKKVKVKCDYNSTDGDFCPEYEYPEDMSQDEQEQIEGEIFGFLNELNVNSYAHTGKVSL